MVLERKKTITLVASLTCLLGWLAPLHKGWAASSNVTVSQSVPIETTLEVRGIPSTQAVWLEMIRGAKSRLDLEEFYIADQKGEALEPVLNEIKAAAGRGVKVRIILDTKFLKNYPEPAGELGQIEGIQVRQYDLDPGVQHSKFILVDQKAAFVGSANLDWLALSHIHEVGVKITDSKVATQLGLVFDKDWEACEGDAGRVRTARASGGNLKTTLQSGITPLASPASLNPAGIQSTLPALKALIESAKQKIRIQVYQYTASGREGKWNELQNSLKAAAERGIQIQILVDQIALKKGSKDLKELASLPGVEVKSLTVPKWSGGEIPYSRLIHSKYMLIDEDAAWVGTENWSQDYFTQSRNVGVVLKAPGVDQTVFEDLRKIFGQLWGSRYVKRL